MPRKQVAAAAVLILTAVNAFAQDTRVARASFSVGIVLNQPNPSTLPEGACLSQALSSLTRAQVTVSCATGLPIGLSARAGGTAAGTHGGAFRFLHSGRGDTGTAGGSASPPSRQTLEVERINETNDGIEVLAVF